MEVKLLLAVVSAMAVVLPATSSLTSCETNIIETLDLVLNMTAVLENHISSQEATPLLGHSKGQIRYSDRTGVGSRRKRRPRRFVAVKHCRVAKTVLENLHDDLNSKLGAAGSQFHTFCNTSIGETTSSCQSVLKLIQCGVRHLKAAYSDSQSLITLERQTEWESVATVLAADTSKVIGDLNESLQQEWSLKLDALSLKLNDFAATVSCMKDVLRAKIVDTVVDKILLGEAAEAGSWFNQINTNVLLLEAIITQTFFRLPKNISQPNTRCLEALSTTVDLLDTLDENPQLATRGYHQVVQGMKATGLWPNLYIKFKIRIGRFSETKCLPMSARIRLLSLQKNLDGALVKYTAAAADLIQARNPMKAKEFFLSHIGDDPSAVVAVVTKAYNRNSDNVDNIISFLELLNNQLYSEKGLQVLYDAMKSNNEISTSKIIKLEHHYIKMRLSDQQLGESIKSAVRAYQRLQDLITQQQKDQAEIKAKEDRARELEEKLRRERESHQETVDELHNRISSLVNRPPKRTTTEKPGWSPFMPCQMINGERKCYGYGVSWAG